MNLRICIAGGPKTGKTTLAGELGLEPVRHTDDTIALIPDWSEASKHVATWMDEPGPWAIEGVALPRALRKWLAANPEGRPCDVVCWLDAAVVPRTPKQDSMAKGCATVWREIFDALVARDVRVIVGAQALRDELARTRTQSALEMRATPTAEHAA